MNLETNAVAVSAQEKKISYQFTAVPTKLMLLCDNNCKAVLFTLLQLSDMYADNQGWFERANLTLQSDCGLSENILRATISSLFRNGIVNVNCNGKTSNSYKINYSIFFEIEKIKMDDIKNRSDLKIETDKYKVKGYKVSYPNQNNKENLFETFSKLFSEKVRTYINTINNKNNIYSLDSSSIEEKIENKNKINNIDKMENDKALNNETYPEWLFKENSSIEELNEFQNIEYRSVEVTEHSSMMKNKEENKNNNINTSIKNVPLLSVEQYNIKNKINPMIDEWAKTHNPQTASSINTYFKVLEMDLDNGSMTAVQYNEYVNPTKERWRKLYNGYFNWKKQQKK